ncbi:MAG TPA: cyclodeaminase/cyclohydrolase family protein [Capillimicrobium sp.]|jgi:formiminotetrahydrofolate cyclodeaminase
MTSSADRSLRELLDDVAAATPAPGGGSSSAWAAALAAALTEMAARFAGDGAAAERAGQLRAEALELGERELSSYAPVLEALRAPREDPARAERVAAALSDAADAPLAIARAAAETAAIAGRLARDGKPSLVGDAAAGEELARAACRAAARLVEINLARADGDPRRGEAAELAAR